MAHDPMAPGVGDIEVTCSLHEHWLENGQRIFIKKGQAHGPQGLQGSEGDYAGLGYRLCELFKGPFWDPMAGNRGIMEVLVCGKQVDVWTAESRVLLASKLIQ